MPVARCRGHGSPLALPHRAGNGPVPESLLAMSNVRRFVTWSLAALTLAAAAAFSGGQAWAQG